MQLVTPEHPSYANRPSPNVNATGCQCKRKANTVERRGRQHYKLGRSQLHEKVLFKRWLGAHCSRSKHSHIHNVQIVMESKQDISKAVKIFTAHTTLRSNHKV